jgi:hypothetical protein
LGPWGEGEEELEETLMEVSNRTGDDPSVVWEGTVEEALSPAMELPSLVVREASKLFAIVYEQQLEKTRSQLIEFFIISMRDASSALRASMYVNYLHAMLETLRYLENKKSSPGSAKLLNTISDVVRST